MRELESIGQPNGALPSSDPKARDRRVVTVLCADVVGSTALIENADAESAMKLLSPAIALMTACVRDCGGTVINRAGDGILAIFGVPAVAEDHARRACRAALELQAAIAGYDSRLDGSEPVELRVRVGLNSGRVLISTIENASGEIVGYDASGAVVHLASRIENSAAPGTICVSQATCWLERERFEFAPLGPAALKGFKRSQLVFRLLGEKKRDDKISERTSGIGRDALRPSPMIGRGMEVLSMSRFFGRLAETATGGLLLVTGDAGIGKTRLLEEVSPLLPPNLLYLAGHALSFGQRLSYWPFIGIIKSLLGVSMVASGADTWAALQQRLAELFPADAEDVLPYLATLLGIDVPAPLSERVRYLDSETLARQVLRAGWRLFERLAQDGPVVLVIDDAHWLDGSSAALLDHLLSVAAELPLLICTLGRDGEAPVLHLRETGASVLQGEAFTEIALQPLSIGESQALVSGLLRTDTDSIERIRDQVLYRAGGNPFYLEEIIRALIDADAIVRTPEGRWAAAQRQLPIIPDTVQGVIMARVDRLDERLKDVLSMAAVIGRRFFYRVLRSIADQQDKLDERLARLKGVELIDDDEIAPEITYIFRHALVQESIYESLLVDRRRRLHAAVADHIEALFPNTSQEFASILALHFARAGQSDKALRYLLEAAEQATRMAGDDEALLHYEEALDTLSRAKTLSWDRAQRAGVEHRLGEIYLRRGEPDRARQHLEAGLAQFGDSLPADRGGVRRAIVAELSQHLSQRVAPWLDRFRPRQQTEAELEVYGALYELMAWMFFFSDHELLLLATLRMATRSRHINRPELFAKATSSLGFVLNTLGAHRSASAYHRRGVDAAERSGHLAAIGLTHDLMAIHLLHTGRWGEAMRCFDRSRAFAQDAGDLHTWSSATILRCELLCELGELAQVMADADAMTAIGRQAAFGPATRWAEVARGKALRRLGRFEEAQDCLERSIRLSLQARDFINLSAAHGELGCCLLECDRLQEGLEMLKQGLDGARTRGVRGHTTAALFLGIAAGAVQNAERAPGKARFAEAELAVRAAVATGRRYRIALVPALRAQATLSHLRGSEAKAKRGWDHAAAEAEKLGGRFEQARCLLEAGTRLGDSALYSAGENLLLAQRRQCADD